MLGKRSRMVIVHLFGPRLRTRNGQIAILDTAACPRFPRLRPSVAGGDVPTLKELFRIRKNFPSEDSSRHGGFQGRIGYRDKSAVGQALEEDRYMRSVSTGYHPKA
eukprot:1171883-Amorphochlora_amoeboformis.AAC.2